MKKGAEQRYVVLGEHFYQPPRSGSHPRVLDIKTDPNGIDWNRVIAEECYIPQVRQGTLEHVSFDFYTTVRREMLDLAPQEAAKLSESMKKRGVGDPFLHVLLPDVSMRDKMILIKAGFEAFQQDTGKRPQWFWAPETALDYETLEVLAEVGYIGVLCAPEQIDGTGTYSDNIPIKIKIPGGMSILALPFDRPFSSTMAFGDKSNADGYMHSTVLPRVKNLPKSRPLIGWTDGETFGHHSKLADVFLNYLVTESLPSLGVAVLGINELTDVWESTDYKTGILRERTAWSCPHGNLIRWNGPCPCDNGRNGEWKTHFSNALKNFNFAVDRLLDSQLGNGWDKELADNFNTYFEFTGSRNSKKSLLAAKASALAAMTSCGTFFESPLTSGNINMLFVQQALAHLSDAGFDDLSIKLQLEFRNTIELANDPFTGSKLTSVFGNFFN